MKWLLIFVWLQSAGVESKYTADADSLLDCFNKAQEYALTITGEIDSVSCINMEN